MRDEMQVLQQIVGFAENDETVRAVILNGSRVNPNAPQDMFCDYDVVFAVTDPQVFKGNRDWIKCFGELIILQQNDYAADGVTWPIFLMLFKDGVRIDLSFFPVGEVKQKLTDSLSRVLLDKDNIIGPLAPPNESSYFVRRPSESEFDEVANDFWWCSTNIAKGLWRTESSYVRFMFEQVVRPRLNTMLKWYIGMNNSWQANPGTAGKWFQKYLPPELWGMLERTYADGNPDYIWNALFQAGELFRTVGQDVAATLGYHYPSCDDRRVCDYLHAVRQMPQFFLRTERLGFALWREQDLKLAMELWGDPQVTKLIGGNFTAQQVKERLTKEIETMSTDGVQYWPLYRIVTGEFVGCCGLRPYKEGILEVGIHVKKSLWGKGFAKEAAQGVICYAFQRLGVVGLFAGHNPENKRSATLLKKLGFTYTHDEFYPPTGLNHPSYILTRDNYYGQENVND